jgi:hypothetical protein
MAQLEERNKVSARVSYVLTRQARAEPHQPVKLALSSMDARGGAPEESGVLSDLEVAHVRRAPRAHNALTVLRYSPGGLECARDGLGHSPYSDALQVRAVLLMVRDRLQQRAPELDEHEVRVRPAPGSLPKAPLAEQACPNTDLCSQQARACRSGLRGGREGESVGPLLARQHALEGRFAELLAVQRALQQRPNRASQAANQARSRCRGVLSTARCVHWVLYNTCARL